MPSSVQVCVARDRETGVICGQTRGQHRDLLEGHPFMRGGSVNQGDVTLACMYCGRPVKRKNLESHAAANHLRRS